VLGKHIAGLIAKDASGNVLRPSWQLVLQYDHEVRKEAYKLIRNNDAGSIAEALLKACTDASIMQLHFLVPLTLSSTSRSSHFAGQEVIHKDRGLKGAKGGGKDKGNGKGGDKTIKSIVKTTVRYCYKFNSSKGCPGGCGYDHVCQRCKGPHSRVKCPNKGAKRDTDKS
jgi:hypothetical protein